MAAFGAGVDSGSDDEEEPMTWVEWFLQRPGHEPLCAVDHAFIEDTFNLYGLRAVFSRNFRECHEMIMGDAPRTDKAGLEHELYVHARNFYGLVHARFVVTLRGVQLMLAKYENNEFPACPRMYCKGTHMLPCGMSDDLGHGKMLYFCPRCEELYLPPRPADESQAPPQLDGAFFGPSFPHMVLLTKSQHMPPKGGPGESYVPRVFGFRVRGQGGRRSLAESMHESPGAARAACARRRSRSAPSCRCPWRAGALASPRRASWRPSR